VVAAVPPRSAVEHLPKRREGEFTCTKEEKGELIFFAHRGRCFFSPLHTRRREERMAMTVGACRGEGKKKSNVCAKLDAIIQFH